MAIRLRPLAGEERPTIRRLARSRTEPAPPVERAPMIRRAAPREALGAFAAHRGCNVEMVRLWVKRFSFQGLDGLKGRPRSGRPPPSTPEEIGTLIAVALTSPVELGLPFGAGRLGRLAAYPRERHGIAIKRSHIDETVRAERSRWRAQET